MKKQALISLFLLSVATAASAQKMSYSKKTNQISIGDKAIAIIDKQKTDGERTYTVANIENGTLDFKFTRYQFEDTFLTETEYYYKIDCPSEQISFYTGNFSEINMQKAIAGEVIDNELLNTDGSINLNGLNAYRAKGVDYPTLFKQRNDSLMEQVMIGAAIVKRDMRKAVEVNKFGKIGQDNTVIGTWEMIVFQPSGFNASKEYCFLIKNLNGGVLAFSWIRAISKQLYVFDNNGVRKKEAMIMSVPADNPINNEVDRANYLRVMAEVLIKRGLL